ncbi:hypothetical protein A4A49_58580, partial [Nicotiana attenuata]
SQHSSQNTHMPSQQSSQYTQQPSQQSSLYTQMPSQHSSHDTQATQMPSQNIQTRIRLIQTDFGAKADPVLRPKVVYDIKTRLQLKNQQNFGTRKIPFTGDHTGSSQPTKLPYSPKRTTWKGNEAMTTAQLLGVKKKKISKLKARRGNGE